ncbi:MAG: hypothetical protein IPM53_31370 [Anaerolineaceae bacterium]|nr:hypothetical protein [Anaerolineaceae bacterium]
MKLIWIFLIVIIILTVTLMIIFEQKLRLFKVMIQRAQRYRSNYVGTKQRVRSVELYLNSQPEPFVPIIKEAAPIFSSLYESLDRAKIIIKDFPRSSLATNHLRWITIGWWRSGFRAFELSRQLAKMEKETMFWSEKVEKLFLLKQNFKRLKRTYLDETHRTRLLFERLNKRLQELRTNGNRGLETIERKILETQDMILQVDKILNDTPDAVAEEVVLAQYRANLGQVYSLQTQIKKIYPKLSTALRSIEKSQKWCADKINDITKSRDKLLDKRSWAHGVGLNLEEIALRFDALLIDIGEAIVQYNKRTPEAYKKLSGSLVNPGTDSCLLRNLETQLNTIHFELDEFKKDYLKAVSGRDDLTNAFKDEKIKIQNVEKDKNELDLCNHLLATVEDLLEEISNLLDQATQQSLRQILPLGQKGLLQIHESADLRQTFIEQQRFLTAFQTRLLFQSESLTKEVNILLAGLDNFHHHYIYNGQNERRIVEDFVGSIHQGATKINHADLAKQSSVRDAYKIGKKVEQEITDLTNQLNRLSTLLKDYQRQYEILNDRDKILRNIDIDLGDMRRKDPLREWAEAYGNFQSQLEHWAKEWRQGQGPLFEDLIAKAKSLEEEALGLKNQFDRDTVAVETSLRTVWGELSDNWVNLNSRLASKELPIPSVYIEDLKHDLLNHENSYHQVVQRSHPREMLDLTNTLDLHLNKLRNRQQSIEQNDEAYKKSIKEAEGAKTNAVKIYENAMGDIIEFRKEGWICLREDRLKALYKELGELQEELKRILQYPSNRLTNELIDEISKPKQVFGI